ncbi:MAG: glycosyltransferase family 9 protein [Flavobacteriales bacterium]
MKILIIRFSSIGDVLLTFHVVHRLKEKHPEAEIHVLTKETFLPLFELLPIPITLHSLDNSLLRTAKSIRKEHFTLILDLHNNLRSRILQALLLNHSWRHVKKLNVKKWLLTALKWDVVPKNHVVDRYLAVAGIDIPAKKPLELNAVAQKLIPTQAPYMAWVIGAKFKTKQFPMEKIQEVLGELVPSVVFLGGETEREESLRLPSSASVINEVGKTSLSEAAMLLKHAAMIVTNDTGLMHLAAFFNKPMVVLWGSTVPSFGMGPYGVNRVMHVEVNGLSCRPCSKIGFNQCPKGHFHCMMLHPSKRIASQINALWYEEIGEHVGSQLHQK